MALFVGWAAAATHDLDRILTQIRRNLVMAVLISLLLSVASSANVWAIDQISQANQTLRGEPAVDWLKANGTYDSLMLAMREAQREIGPAGGQSFISQTAKVWGEDAPQSTFGHSVSVWGDTAVVGAYLEEVNGETFHGSAYVFVRNGDTWTRQARLLADDGTVDDRFGSSVAIVGDTIVIGAMGDDLLPPEFPPNQGSAYVYVRNAGVWTLQTKLQGDLDDSAAFGISIGMSGDTIIVGTLGATFDAQENGSAYVFVRSGNDWLRQAKLTAADFALNDRFGFAVAIDGNTAIVGAYRKRIGNNNHQGAAYVFVRNGVNWSQQARLVADDGVQFDNFGWSVGLSGDTAIVGAISGDGSFEEQGSAYVFVRNGSAWTQQAKLLAADGLPFEDFGWSVAVSGDLIIVGARLAHLNSDFDTEGAAYAFTRSDGIWTQRTKFFAADAAQSNGFGASVAISGDTVVVGADNGNVGNNPHQGAAYVFAVNGAPPSPTPPATPPPTATPGITPTPTPTAPPLPSATPTPTPTPAASPIPSATPTGTATPTPTAAPSTLGNISTRLRLEMDDNVLIGGFIVTGLQPKKVILRAIGPSLPVAGALADPVLELRNSSGGLILSNDNWRDDPVQESEIIATTIPPSHDLESAIVATLPANNSAYTVIVRGVSNGTGVGLVEAYDLDRAVDSKLANISTRGLVQSGDNVLIAGTIVLGDAALRVLARAIGPSLPVPGKLENPTLELRDGNGALLAANDNWRDDPAQESEIIATGIPPSNDLESAIVQNLTPGSYTAIVRGVNNTTGIAVVEAYGLN
jgi:hypothetical protein